MDHGHPDHRLARLGEVFVVFAQPAIPIAPAQGTFDNPAFREHGKALGGRGPRDNLQVHRSIETQPSHPIDQGASIRLIRPDAAQPREPVPEDLQQALGPVAVLDTGRGDDYGEEQPEGIDEEVAFAPFDLLVGIKAAEPPFSVVLTD